MTQDLDQAYNEFCEVWLEGEKLDVKTYCKKFPAFEDALCDRLDKFIKMYQRFQEESGSRCGAPSQAYKEESRIEGEILGDFRLIREVDRGGMGVVYEAHQVSLNRNVALKVLSANLTLREETVARFHREASTAAKLKHPGIVKIHGIGEKQGNHFFAMEFVRGAPLDQVIEELYHGSASPREGKRLGAAVLTRMHGESQSELLCDFWNRTYIEAVCRIIAQVADALEYAHKAGVIHRDIKPSNILVREDGGCVLTDFGLARELELASLTLTGELAGTPHYLAPELAAQKGKTSDHRADIYSLGVTLYEMLTLARPYEGRTSQEILGKIVSRSPALPRSKNPLIPKDLETICLTAMEKDPARRYETAMAFKEDLLNFLEFRPIQARPPGLGERAYRLIRRNPAYSAMTVLIFLIVVIGPMIFGLQQHLSNQRVRGALNDKVIALKKAEAERGAKEEALKLSKEEAAVATQITTHLESIFSRFIPEAAEWKRSTADLLLKDAASAIDSDLADQPRIQRRLMLTLGRIYMMLGNFEEGERLLSKAMETLSSSKGDADETTLSIKQCLASIYTSQARYTESLELHEDLMEDLRAVYGDRHAYTNIHMDHLASLYVRMGEGEKAERIYLETLNRCQRDLGEDHKSTFHCLLHLGHYYLEKDQLDEAESFLNLSLKRSREYLGEDHHYTLAFKRNLGVLAKKRGDHQRAEILFQEVHENYSDMHCENCNMVSSLTMGILTDLGELLREQGRVDEEESLYVAAFERNQTHLGEDHPATLSSMMRLGYFLVNSNRLEEAASVLSRCIERCRRSLGKDHPFTIETLGLLGDLCSKQDRAQEAKDYYYQVLKGYRYSLSEGHPITMELKTNLAAFCNQWGWYEEGKQLIRETLKHTPIDSHDYAGRKMLYDFLMLMTGEGGKIDKHTISWRNPNRLKTKNERLELVFVTDPEYGERMLIQCEKTYDQLLKDFSRAPEQHPIMTYLLSDMDEYNTMGNLFGDERSSTYGAFYLNKTPENIPASMTYVVGTEDSQLRFTEGLVRHGVVEQYLRKIDKKNQFPSWFIKGQAAKYERYFHPSYIQWSVREGLEPLGGWIDPKRIFETFKSTEHEIHMAGLICAFLDWGSLNPQIKAAYDQVVAAIRNEEDLTKEFTRLERLLFQKEADLKEFMKQSK